MLEKYPDYEIYNVDALTYAGDLMKHEKILKLLNDHFIYGVTKEAMLLVNGMYYGPIFAI